MNVAEVKAVLTADTSQWDAAMRRANDLLKDHTTQSVAAGTAIGNMLAQVAQKAQQYAVAIPKFMIDAARSAGEYAESLEHISAVTALNTRVIQDWSVGLNRVGLHAEDLSHMMRRLSQNIVEAQRGTAEATQKFGQMGITITSLSTTESVIREIADASARMGESVSRTAAMTDLLGRSAIRMLPLFKDGAKTFDEASLAANRLATTLNDAQLKTLRELDDAWDDLHKAQEGFVNQVGAFVAPAIKLIVDGLTEGISKISQFVRALQTTNEVAPELLAKIQAVGPGAPMVRGGQLQVPAVGADIEDIRSEDALTVRTAADVEALRGGTGVRQAQVAKRLSDLTGIPIDLAREMVSGRESEGDILAMVGLARAQAQFGEYTVKYGAGQALAFARMRAGYESDGVLDIGQFRRDKALLEATPRGGGNLYEEAYGQRIQDALNLAYSAREREEAMARVRGIEVFGPGVEEEVIRASGGYVPERLPYDPLGRQGQLGRAGTFNAANSARAAQELQDRIYGQITEGMQLATRDSKELGEGMLRAAQDMDALREAMDATRQAAPILEMQELSEKSLAVGRVNAAWINSLDEMHAKTIVLGRDYDSTADQAAALSRRMIELVRHGLDPTSDEFQQMKRALDQLTDDAKFTKMTDSIIGSLGFAFDTVVQGVLLGTQTISQAFQRLGVDILASFGRTFFQRFMETAGKSALESIGKELLGSAAGSFGGLFSGMSFGGTTLGAMGGPAIAAGVTAATGAGFIGSQIINRTDFSRPRNQAGAALMAIPFIGLPNLLLGNPLGNLIGGLFDDGTAGRMRNESDFINGTVAAAKDYLTKLSGAQSPAELQRMLANGVLPGAQGGIHGTITSRGSVLGGPTIGFQSMGNFRFLGSQMSDAAGEFVKGIQSAVDKIVEAFRAANRQLSDAVTSLFSQSVLLRAGTMSLGDLTSVRGSLAGQLDARIAEEYGILSGAKTGQDVLGSIQTISALVRQRYQGEVELVQAWADKTQRASAQAKRAADEALAAAMLTVEAWRGLRASVSDQLAVIRMNQFGPPSGAALQDYHRGRFSDALAAFRAAPSPELGAAVSGLASPYLQAAQANFGGDFLASGYQAVYEQVVAGLEEVEARTMEAEQEFQDAQSAYQQALLAAQTQSVDVEQVIADNTAAMARSLDVLRASATAQANALGFSIPSFDVGTDYVPRDMIAKVHKGEQIVPAGKRGGSTVSFPNAVFIGLEPAMLDQLARKLKPYIDSQVSYAR